MAETSTMVVDEVVPGDGSPVPEMVPREDTTDIVEAVASTTASEVATGVPVTSTGPAADAPSSPPRVVADGNTIEQPEVIMGHRTIRASGDVSLFDVIGTSHFALNQVNDVIHREKADKAKE
jgi:hypothetical protein